MKIIELKVTNIKRIIAVDIQADGKMNIIDGEGKAEIKIDIGKYIVTRKWSNPENSTISIKTKEGHTVSPPKKEVSTPGEGKKDFFAGDEEGKTELTFRTVKEIQSDITATHEKNNTIREGKQAYQNSIDETVSKCKEINETVEEIKSLNERLLILKKELVIINKKSSYLELLDKSEYHDISKFEKELEDVEKNAEARLRVEQRNEIKKEIKKKEV